MTLDASHLPRQVVADSLNQYEAALFDDIVPWWQRHSPDVECGGFFCCLERDGSVYAGEKFMWMLGRQIWMLSRLYSEHDPRDEWIRQAEQGAEFLLQHAFREDGKMHFRLSQDGKPRASCLSLYTECFAVMGLAELSKANADEKLWARAVEMYDRLLPRLGEPNDTPMLGYPLNAKFHLHAHDMIRLTLAWLLNELSPEPRWEADIALSVDSILQRHWKPKLGALLENVDPRGEPLLDLPEGRMFHPGHSIESAWMLMEVARQRSDESLLNTAVDIVLAALEHGWDERYGGLRYLTNIDRTPTHELEADMKLWWPHSETLYALLLGWALTAREDLHRWYEDVHEYAFSAFPDPLHGEWFGYLNRDGSPAFTAKGNGWKGFFHLPRAMFRCYQLLLETEKHR